MNYTQRTKAAAAIVRTPAPNADWVGRSLRKLYALP